MSAGNFYQMCQLEKAGKSWKNYAGAGKFYQMQGAVKVKRLTKFLRAVPRQRAGKIW